MRAATSWNSSMSSGNTQSAPVSDQARRTARRVAALLANADDRIDRARVDLTAKRYSSDRLRVRLIEGQLSLARIREFIKLLMRLDKIRREFG